MSKKQQEEIIHCNIDLIRESEEIIFTDKYAIKDDFLCKFY